MKWMHSLVLVILLLVAGCGFSSLQNQSGRQPAPADLPSGLARVLPPVPNGDAVRAASLIGPVTLPGVGAFDDFGSVAYGASTAELTPPDSALAGVIYALPVNGFSYDEITFNITFADPAKLWFGVGDYVHGCWALTPASNGITGVAPPYSTAHAPDGNAYFAVLAWDDTAVTVHEVALAPNIPTWRHQLIDDDQGISGYVADIVEIDGYLYIAYEVYESGVSEEIRLARATEPVPTEPGHWYTSPASSSDVTEGLDLAEVNGLPALIYSEG